MRKLISFMHISLDGFVAGPQGEMDWITVNEEIFDHVGKRISGGDTAVYGRVTYQMMQSYWPDAGKQPGASRHDIDHSRWYEKVRKVVLSKTMSGEGLVNTHIIHDDNLVEAMDQLKQQPGEDILVFGSPTATHSLTRHDLVDGYWLFLNPVILGQGIRLFEGLKERTGLTLESTNVFECGVIAVKYRVDR